LPEEATGASDYKLIATANLRTGDHNVNAENTVLKKLMTIRLEPEQLIVVLFHRMERRYP
jgi:hypothetical protein